MMHIQFQSPSSSSNPHLTSNPIPDQHPVAFIMGYSHVMKKIRNSLLNSRPGGVRMIENAKGRLGGGIQPQLEIQRKLTYTHIFPENTNKMRNHLTEKALNEDILQLVLNLRVQLGPHGARLDSLLQQTSILVKRIRDRCPMTDPPDSRVQLHVVFDWFREWENGINSPSRLRRAIALARNRSR